jgi:hypothetical protein
VSDAPVPTPHHGARGARAILAALLVLVAALLGSPTATAALPAATTVDPGAMTWGVVPADTAYGTGRANFAYDAVPGDVIQDAVVITNHGAAPLALDVYAADARTTTSGQLDLLTAAETSVDLGAWIRLDLPAVTLEAGASIAVPFTVQIPTDALPGDHSGGVITASVGADDGSTVRVDRRLALRVHLRVAGAIAPAVTVDDLTVSARGTVNPFGAPTVVVRYRVTNTGNARVVPQDVVTVAGALGTSTTVDATGTDPVEVLPGSSVEREVVVRDVRTLTAADVRVDVVATAVGVGGGATAAASATGSAAAVPWAAVVLLGLVLAGIGGGLVLRRRARARGRAAAGGIVLTDDPQDEGQPA